MALGIFLIMSVISAVLSSTLIDINEYTPTWNTFKDPDGMPLLLVEVFSPSDEVFVAGANVLYHLNKDLKVIKKVSLGPKFVCKTPEGTCEKPMRKNYIPFSMQINPNLDMLLICSSLYEGACELRPLKDLETSFWIGPHGEPVSKCINQHRDPSFIVSSGVSYAIFCGVDTNGNGTHSMPFLSKKELLRENGTYQFKYYSIDNDTHISAAYFDSFKQIHFSSFFKRLYSYFFFLRIAPDNRFQPRAMLSRLSNDSPTFSYSEIALLCEDETHRYKVGFLATLGPDDKLYVLFINSTHMGICRYDMGMVDKRLSDDVYTSEDKPDCDGHSNPDYCRSIRNPVINGRPSALVSTPLWNLEGDDLRSRVLRVLKQNGQLVAFVQVISPNAQLVLKVNLLKKSIEHLAVIDKKPLSFSTSFDLREENLYFIQENILHQFPIGLCSLFNTCKKCLSSPNDPLECGWCDNRCDLRKNCPPGTYSKGACPPILLTFSPNKGPSWGKTELTITGENFGAKNGTYTVNTVLVAGVDCSVLSWDINRILCETGPTVKAVTGPVVVMVQDGTQNMPFMYRGTIASESIFTYIMPKIFGIYPGKGFSRGGTNVTLYGENLDIGDEYSVNIYKKECVNPIVQSNLITCTTTGHEKKSLENAIQIVINGHSFDIQGPPPSNFPHAVTNFYYVPFPVIENVYPSMLFASAGHNVTVTGLFFDSAVEAEMLLSFLTLEILYYQPCWLDTDSKGTVMKCLTPDLRNHKQVVGSRAYVKFRIDGEIVPSTGSIFFLPDPVFEPLEKTKSIPYTEKILKLKGNFPNEKAVKESLKIQIGDRWLCNIVQIIDDWLHCTLPNEILTDSSHWDNILTVQVFTDSSPQYIGSIIIQKNSTTSSEGKTENETKLPVFVIVIICLGVVVLIGIFIGVWRWKKTSNCFGLCSKTLVSTNVELKNGLPNEVKCNPQCSDPSDSCSSRPITFLKHPPHSEPSLLFNTPLKETNQYYLSMDKNSVTASSLESEPLLCDGVDHETIQTLHNENLIVNRKHLMLGKKLGQGQFGEVYKAKYNYPRKGERDVAVKTIKWDPENCDGNQEFILEGVRMKDFRHKNVIELIGICFEGGMPKIVIPYMENGDLLSYLKREITLWYYDLLKFSADIAAGMAYLAKEKFVHRDLAARNCMLDGSLTVKVGDFGLTRDIYEKNYYRKETERKLPLRWMSPESLEKNVYFSESDVWSYGIVLWEIMTRGEMPYGDSQDFLKEIKNGFRLSKPKVCCDRMYRVMRKCWIYELSHRPTFDDLCIEISMIQSPQKPIYQNC